MLTSFIFGVLGVVIIFLIIVISGLIISLITGDIKYDSIYDILYKGMLGALFALGMIGIVGFLVLFGDVMQGKFK